MTMENLDCRKGVEFIRYLQHFKMIQAKSLKYSCVEIKLTLVSFHSMQNRMSQLCSMILPKTPIMIVEERIVPLKKIVRSFSISYYYKLYQKYFFRYFFPCVVPALAFSYLIQPCLLTSTIAPYN